MGSSILWFRHGLRVHDNPALLQALKSASRQGGQLYPIFIFDGETAGTRLIGYNRLKFLLESLQDLDATLRKHGGKLHIFQGQLETIFRHLIPKLGIKTICFEQDCEPIWRARDDIVENLCHELNVECIQKVSHTLWDPMEIIKTNGGIPPLTYQKFLQTVQTIGVPSRPVEDPSWDDVRYGDIPRELLKHLRYFRDMPNSEELGMYPEQPSSAPYLLWIGGETEALKKLNDRLARQKEAFERGYYLPNQAHSELLEKTTSMSAHLRYGCLSVRKFYWNIHDLFASVQHKRFFQSPSGPHITDQLIWREYFYTMSVLNPKYGEMKDNPICLNIPWSKPNVDGLERWKNGRTGFPLVDAAMRQLLAEGWIHHTLRNATATFLTRGGMWVSWEYGLQHFLEHLIDADWSVCAGNWVWVSSSAFEKLLDFSRCTCPIALGRRIDPEGEYIKRYVPELRNMPQPYIHEPWKAPLSIQAASKCVIGMDYSERIINLDAANERNNGMMKALRNSLVANGAPVEGPSHCRPSNNEEIRQFFWLVEEMF